MRKRVCKSIHGGVFGDFPAVWVARKRMPAFLPTAIPMGVALLPKPRTLPVAPMGVVPVTGTLAPTLWTTDHRGPKAGFLLFLQALVVGQSVEVRLSRPWHVFVRNT